MYFLTRDDYVGLIYQLLTGLLIILVCDMNKRVENPLKPLLSILLPGPTSSSSRNSPETLSQIHSQVRLFFHLFWRSFRVLFRLRFQTTRQLHFFFKEGSIRIG